MSLIGSKGFYGVSTQLDKDTATASWTFFEPISAPLQPVENTSVRRPTIGDQPLPRGAYKLGSAVQSALGLEVTPDSPGQMLYYMLGYTSRQDNVWTVTVGSHTGGTFDLDYDDTGSNPQTAATLAYDIDAEDLQAALEALSNLDPGEVYVFGPTGGPWTIMTTKAHTGGSLTIDGTSLTGGSGHAVAAVAKTGHVFKMKADDPYFIPYFTAIRGVGTAGDASAIQDKGIGCKVAGGSVAFVANDAMQMAFQIMGIKPAEDGTTPTIAYDDGNIMTVVGDDAFVELELNGTLYGSSTGTNIDITAASLQWDNMLTPATRYKIGRSHPIDLTLQDRVAVIQLGLEIENDDLYSQIYYSGGSWTRTVMVGSFQIRGSNQDGDQFILTCKNTFFTGLLVVNQPQRVVEARLSATLLKTTAGDAITLALINDNSTGYSIVADDGLSVTTS